MKLKMFGILAVLLAATLFATPAMAQSSSDSSKFGIGLGAGTVAAGLSFKTLMSESTAFQATVGSWRGYGRHWHFSTSAFALGADFLMEQPPIFNNEVVEIGWNLGLGAGVGLISDATVFGATGIAGLEFNFVPAPIDFVVEYRPGLYVGAGYGDANLSLSFIDFTGHIRVWF